LAHIHPLHWLAALSAAQESTLGEWYRLGLVSYVTRAVESLQEGDW
jgi:hypothetical protein